MAVAVPGNGIERLPHASPTNDGAAAIVPVAPRLHWIDWLRVGAIVGVVFYHSLRAFDTSGWHVKNAETSEFVRAGMVFFESFGLALLFLLAGAGARFALRRRTSRTFVRERALRLAVPFVVGTLFLSPPQGFLEALNHDTYQGSFLAYLPVWFGGAAGWAMTAGFTPSLFGVGYHLWFLGFLFAFSLIGVPLFARLASGRGRAAIENLARRSEWPGSSLAFAVPIAIVVMVFLPLGTDQHDWGEFGWYFGYFVAGYILVADERFLPAVRRDLPIAVVVGVVASVALAALDFGGWLSTFPGRGIDPAYPAMLGLFVLEGWAWTLVVLNAGLRVPQLQRPVGPRVGDAVLPVYVIHQPVILAVAFVVVQWPVGILPKWIVVFGVSAVVTLALVGLALRAPVARLLLGAHARPAAPAAPPSVLVAPGGPEAADPAVMAQHVGTR